LKSALFYAKINKENNMPNLLYYKTLDFSRANLKKVLKSIKDLARGGKW
jgi:hypothetical protein